MKNATSILVCERYQTLSDEYLEPVPPEESESDSGKFVLRHGKKISTSKSKYEKPSK